MLNFLLSTVLVTIGGGSGDAETSNLKFKQVKKWDINLPSESWTEIEHLIPIGSGFAVNNTEFKLEIDTNADSRPDSDIKGSGGFALLRGKREDGSKYSYAIRVRPTGSTWEYACAGLMSTKVNGVNIALIDQNNNGIWNEVGVDALIIGKGSAASYLSEVVNLDGELFNLSASETGETISITPFEGESGFLNVVEAYNSKAKLTSAVFTSADSKYSFELSASSKGMQVPAGKYQLTRGSVNKGVEYATIRRGSMKAIEIEGGKTKELNWGGPLRIEFDTERTDAETITVRLPSFYGNADEEYFDFLPGGKSPTIVATDNKTGKEIWSGKFCEG
ncbi:MAG: hypothetical protein QGF46_00305 [Planctomycetota bacterium]|nr:hypothetical protein [Planctomycetota bacterium]